MNDAEVRHALERAAREISGADAVAAAEVCRRARATFFIDQTDVSEDPGPLISVRCPRQVGKTYWAATEALCCMEELDEAHLLYITLTRDQSKRNFWEPVQKIAAKHGFTVETNETDLRIINPRNGSWLILRGCEDEHDAAKFEGTYYDRVFIDESQEIRASVLEKLIYKSLVPCLAYRAGRIYLMGRPVGAFTGEFFRVTGPTATNVYTDEEGERRAVSRPWLERHARNWDDVIHAWSLHSWSQERNTAAPHIWLASLAMKRRMGWSDSHPTWMRECLGLWAVDESLLVYYFKDALAPEGTCWEPLAKRTPQNPFGVPVPTGTPLRYVIGADAGGVDPYTIEISAYSPTHPVVYEACWEFEESKIGLRKFALAIAEAMAFCAGWDGDPGELIEPPRALQGLPFGTKYGKKLIEFAARGEDLVDDVYVDIDKFGGEIIDMMAADYFITLKPAKKTSKRDHQEALNTDAEDRRALCRRDSKLAKERIVLTKDPSGLKDNPSQKNNCCDASLYATTNARHHDAREVEVEEQKTPERVIEDRLRAKFRPKEPDAEYTDIGSIAPIDEWQWTE